MAFGNTRAPLAVLRALARTGLTSRGAASLAAWTGVVASIPLALGAARPSSWAAAAWTRDCGVLERTGSNVGASSMMIPRRFLGSLPADSPLLWSRASTWGPSSVPNLGASACGCAPPAGAAAALAVRWAPDGSTGKGPPESDSDRDGDGGEGVLCLGGLERVDEMESARLPRDWRDGETERFWRSTFAAVGTGRGSTSGGAGDRDRLGERGAM